LSLVLRYLACFRAFVVSLAGSCPGGSPANTPGPLVTRSPNPGIPSRRQMALPSSRVPPVQTCPALRPRWCPGHLPYRTPDCCLPATGHRRLPTTLPFSGLHHAAYLLVTPGFVRPLAGRHAGSLLTCWLDFNQEGFALTSAHLLGNINQFRRIAPIPKVSGLPWRDQCQVRCDVGTCTASGTTLCLLPSNCTFRVQGSTAQLPQFS
jgi:hypothetical protein